jgi:4-aminobutyrate aminotransferase
MSMEPLITIKPPGPNARAIIERDAKVISHSLARQYPLVLRNASGINLWDVDNNRYLDLTAGFAVMNVGWNHPNVVRAVEHQLKYLSHGSFLSFYSDVPVTFAERLTAMLPPPLNQVYLSNSGAESVEAAMKLARHHTKRKYFIAFYGAFHGRTYGALSLTASKAIYRRGFGPFLSVFHVPFPNPYRPYGGSQERGASAVDATLTLMTEVFKKEAPPEEIAAIFVEPIQGEGGYIVPPKTFLQELRSICDENGILLVADEVQAGCYRTGTFLASEQFGVTPDIVCLSKAIGGGLPLGVMASSEEIMTWEPGAHASTFAGNALSCAAGTAVLDIMKEPGFGDHVVDVGEHLLRGLRALQRDYEIIGEVRGRGLMSAIELVRSRTTKEPAAEERAAVIRHAFESGVTILSAGESSIRFCPPLTIEKEDIDIGLEVLRASLETVATTRD